MGRTLKKQLYPVIFPDLQILMAIVGTEKPECTVLINFLNGHWSYIQWPARGDAGAKETGFGLSGKFPDFFNRLFSQQILMILFFLHLIDTVHLYYFMVYEYATGW